MNLNKGNIKDRIDFCQIDITKYCNLKCIFCRQQNEKDIPDDMSISEWFDVIDQLIDMKCTRLSIAGGEPLLSPIFIKILKYANEKIGKASILSNGTLLTFKKAKEIAPFINNIQISVDALDPSLHDKIRGQRGAWNKTITGVKNAVKAGISVGMRITIFEENVNEAIPLMHYANSLGVTAFLARSVKAK